MQFLEKLLSDINGMVWGFPMLILLFGTHLFLTFRLGFVQRFMGRAIRLTFAKDHDAEGDVSHWGALATALAATVGTGNIIGVATAISAGGPGAVLWMWLTGVFGIATKYAEALLAVKYRVKTSRGSMAGGAMYVIEKGMHCRWLAILFAVFTAIAAFGIGNMVQANSIATLAKETFHISPWITGVILTILTASVILGGIKWISRVCATLVPFMILFYLGGCIALLILKAHTLPYTLSLIFESAFSGQAAIGGFLGAGVKEAMRYGIARGLFSNESGMGSAPIVAAAARTKDPVHQALVSASGTFWDTVVVCAFTGVVLVNSGDWTQGLNGAALIKAAFSHFPLIGPLILNIGLFTFVFSTILGWSYYGEKAVEYLFNVHAVRYYRWLWVAAVMVGSLCSLKMVFDFADIANALMAIPNLIVLLVLNKVVLSETKRYFAGKPHVP